MPYKAVMIKSPEGWMSVVRVVVPFGNELNWDATRRMFTPKKALPQGAEVALYRPMVRAFTFVLTSSENLFMIREKSSG